VTLSHSWTQAARALLLISALGLRTAAAQAGGKIAIARMRPAGLLIDAYSYMTPPHSEYYFHHMDQLGFRLGWVRRSGPPYPLVVTAGPALNPHFRKGGADLGLDEYFTRNRVAGLLVLRGDTVLLERYAFGADRRSRFVSQSVGKSVVSILVGAAVARGKITSVNDPVTKYLPELSESGYRSVTVKQALQMATGVGYSEDYRDSTSGAAKIGAALVAGTPSFHDFVRSMKPTAVAPGTRFEYQSVNTQLLGMLLERVTGMTLATWAEAALWSKLGADRDAFFYQAKSQPGSCAFACFNATLRDYGRIGLLMMNRGTIDGREVVPASWVDESTRADADYLRPGAAGQFGYGYQWWIPAGADGAFMAIGIFGQAIYVNPARHIVVVQTSAWPTPIGVGGESADQLMMFEAIAAMAGR
jgi:CubicO group peptidase (beta-lactamase class C family)